LRPYQFNELNSKSDEEDNAPADEAPCQ
jgi:hypothetical protein